LKPCRGLRRLAVAVSAALAVAAGGCGLVGDDATSGRLDTSLTSNEGTAVPGGRLVVAVPAESNGWNPLLNQWSDSGTLVGTSMIEPLAVQENDGTPRPWLAESWSANADATQWTVNIRPGVLFHDDTPLTAEVVKRNLDESLESGFHQVTRPLYDRIEVTGPLTVKVYLTSTWALWPISLANEWIMAPSMLDRTDAGTVAPVGTGPFRFVAWAQGRQLQARRWARYWRKDDRGEALPYLDEVQFRVVVDDHEREQALRDGTVDLALSNTGDISSRLDGSFDVIKDYNGQRTYLMLNTAVGKGNEGNPFTNVHARRALAHATDRRRVAQLVGPHVQSTTMGFRPDSPFALAGDDRYPAYDPAKARAEIDQYLKDTKAKKLAFTMLGPTAPEAQTVLQGLAAGWRAVGIEADISGVDAAKHLLLTALGQYQACWFRFFDYPDPDLNNFYLSSSTVKPVGELSLNFTHYSTRRMDANLAVLRRSTDRGARKAASDDIVREMNEQVLNLWLYDTPESLVAARRVRGLDGFRSHGLANNLPKPWLAEVWLNR
jgi:peptide/nickel transport system substrate-binding protein